MFHFKETWLRGNENMQKVCQKQNWQGIVANYMWMVRKESGMILEVSGIRDGKVMMALIQQGTQEDEQAQGREEVF